MSSWTALKNIRSICRGDSTCKDEAVTRVSQSAHNKNHIDTDEQQDATAVTHAVDNWVHNHSNNSFFHFCHLSLLFGLKVYKLLIKFLHRYQVPSVPPLRLNYAEIFPLHYRNKQDMLFISGQINSMINLEKKFNFPLL